MARLAGSQPDVNIHTVNPPLPLAQQTPQPLNAQARPLGPPHGDLIDDGSDEGLCGGVYHFVGGCIEGGGGVDCGRVGLMARSRLEPVTPEIEEALVGPVAGGQEEDEEEDGAVDAGAVEEVGADEEEEDEGWGGVGGDEEEGEPARREC